jgi:serine/threonine-protein kinase
MGAGWERVKDVVGEALGRPLDARDAFVREACRGADDLRGEVDSLLAANQQMGHFLSDPACLEREANGLAGCSPGLGPAGAAPAAAPARLVPGARLGPYEVVSFLGAGGMGEVYQARDTRLDRTVAIKVLPADAAVHADRLRRFEREARAVSLLSHPHICALYDVGEHEGSSFLVMEYLEGESLAQRLRAGPMPLDEALRCAMQVAEALQEAHQHGVVHRDLKPANVVLTKNGAKLLDFGVAKLQTVAPESIGSGVSTSDGQMIGTVPYMAPEQLEGGPIDERTDVFGFGLLLYEMVSGRRAFEPTSGPRLIAALLKDDPTPLSEVQPLAPRSLEAVIERCLARDPARRWSSIAELMAALRRQQRARPRGTAGRRVAAVLARLRRGNAWAAVAVATVLSLAGASAALHRVRPDPRAIDSIAVLPLADAGGEAGSEYLADGVTESIISSLSHLPQLRVMARSTVFTYKGREVDPRQVGADLNVRAVLTGRVRRQGHVLAVAAELVDARDGSRIWGGLYERPLSDIFAVQDEIAREITANLRLRLTATQEQQLTKRYTEDAEAYRLYLQGRYLWNKRTDDDVGRAIDYFERAIARDPGFALAHAGLADAHVVRGIWDIRPPKESFPPAKAAATSALARDERLAEAHTALAAAYMYHDRDFAAAEAEFKRAIELNPNYAIAHLWYANLLTAIRRPEAALVESRRAQELDPFSLIVNAVAGWTHYAARRQDEGLDRVQKTGELDRHFWAAHWYLGVFYEEKKMYREAIAAYERSIDLSGGLSRTIASLGHAYAISGQPDRAREVLGDLRRLSATHYVSAYAVAQIHAGLGDKEAALQWLEKALEERHGWVILLGVDPDFDGLRSDPRFGDVMRRAGLQRYWM